MDFIFGLFIGAFFGFTLGGIIMYMIVKGGFDD